MHQQIGSIFVPSATRAATFVERIPGGVYIVGSSPEHGFYLQAADPVTIPAKVYGNGSNLADKFFRTYMDRERNTGVLLSGEKGAGKSLQARQVALKFIQEGMPVLRVESSFHGKEFTSMLEAIKQPFMLFFDEFEKVYGDRDDQAALLTLLDGSSTANFLALFTVNDKYKVDRHFINRPGRIFYHLTYEALGSDLILEYCSDCLINKSWVEDIQRIAMASGGFTFDMLVALVEESNRYGEDPYTAVKLLNISPEYSSVNYVVTEVWIGEHRLTKGESKDTFQTFSGNPVSRNVELNVETVTYIDSDGDKMWDALVLTPAKIKSLDTAGRLKVTYLLETEHTQQPARVVVEEEDTVRWSYDSVRAF